MAVDVTHAYLPSDPVATTPFFSFENINFQTDDAEQIICCYSLDEDRLAFRQSQFRIPGKEKDDAEFAIFCGSHSGGPMVRKRTRIRGH